MENAEATSYLSQFIGKTLQIHTTDSRMFSGQMKCTDKDRNIILALTHEYRQPSEASIRKAIEETGNPTPQVPVTSRYVGLVVVPGEHITKIEYVQSIFSPNSVVL